MKTISFRVPATKLACAAALVIGLEMSASAANFVPMSGSYSGLFYEPDGIWQQSSGYITLLTTARGKYSGRLQLGARRYGFSGYFDSEGRASRGILRHFENPLTIEFQVSPDDPDLIVGTVSDGTWMADLIADRAVFDGKNWVSPDYGRYTLLIPGDFTSHDSPGGDSYGTVTVDKRGGLRFAGSLADGTKVSQSTRVSKNGQWPLYAPLYRGEGSLYAWMLVNPSPEEELKGDVTWIRPAMPWTWYYPDGFAVNLEAFGSRYIAPARGQKIIDLTYGLLEANGGHPEQAITNSVFLDSSNRIINHSPNGLRMSFSPSSGLFSGRIMNPVTWEWFNFRGVVLQRYNVAGGYFLTWDESGEVWLQEPESTP
jgi:hypothetical protein